MIGHLLNRRVTVLRPVITTDEVGGQAVALEPAGTIPVKIGQPRPDERTLGDQWGARLTHVAHTLATADVRRGDELVDDLDQPSERLRVISVISDSHGTYRRLELEAVQAEGAR